MAQQATERKEFAFASFAATIGLVLLILARMLFGSLPFAGEGDLPYGTGLGLWVLLALLVLIDTGVLIKLCTDESRTKRKPTDNADTPRPTPPRKEPG